MARFLVGQRDIFQNQKQGEIMFKILVALLMLSSYALAANNADIIWTWGNGKSIAAVFSFLYFFLNIDSLAILIKYAAIIGMLVVFMREYAKGDGMKPSILGLKMFMFFAITQATVIFFLTVKQTSEHRVYILSANELSLASWSKCRPVNGDDECYAPIGIKLLFSTLTNFEKAALTSMESAMMDANALTYSFSRMGYGFGLNYADAMSKATVGTHQYNTFMEFHENCIVYDLSDGSKDVESYYKSKDLSSYIISSNSRLTTVYNNANPTGIVKACYEVTQTDLLGTITCTQKAQSLMAGLSGAQAAETSINDICTAGENFTQQLFDSTKSADDSIKQQIAINLSNEAMVNSAVASGLNPSELAYGSALAQREMQGKWTTMGMLAKEWIPSMRGVMQGIAIGLIWILALMSIATASPAPYLGSVIGFQLSLVVWSLMLSLINYMAIERITSSVPNLFISDLGTTDQLTLMTNGAIKEETHKAMAFLGYMAIASYGVAAGLIKLGGNMLSSLGNGVGQLSVGMGVSSDMARGHQDYGLTKAGVNGTQSVNKRGGLDVVNANGSQEHTNLNGVDTNTTTDGAGTKHVTQKVNGKSTTSMETTGGNKASYDGGNVTGVTVNNGTTGAIQELTLQSASQEKAKAMQRVQTSEEAHTRALTNQNSLATDAIKTASQADGTEVSTTQQEAEKRAFSKTLDEMVANKEIDSQTKEKASQLYSKAQMEGRVGFDTDKQFGTKILGMATGVSASLSASAAGGWQGTSTDKDAHQSALEKSFADKFSKNYSHESSSVLATSSNVSQSTQDSFSSKFSQAQTQSNATANSYKEALSVAQTATQKEQYVKSHADSISKDSAQHYLQEVADKAGGGEAGLQAVKTELNRLESAHYAYATFKERAETNGKLDIQKPINTALVELEKAEDAISGGKNIQTRENNDNKAREQGMLNESYVNSKITQHKNPRGNNEH